MSKFTIFAVGLLSVISIVPTAQAATSNHNPATLQKPAGDLHAQVIIRLGGPPAPFPREGFHRRRQWEIQREREADRRREFYSGRHRERGDFRGETQVEFRGEPRFERRVEPRFEPRPPH